MELQHVNVKLLLKDAGKVDLEAVVPVFHRWIQGQAHGELLLDVADYRHVREGPGVVLIGHWGNYSVDNSGGRLGVRYNRKAPLEGTNQDRLLHATQAVLAACQRLETEPSLDGKIQFDGRELEIFVNDRLLAPNTPETRSATDAEFRTLFSTLFGGTEYVVSYSRDPRRVFSVHVKTSQAFDTTALLNNLVSRMPVSHLA